MPRLKTSRRLAAAIDFSITIERESEREYHVWLGLAEEPFDESPFAFIAGTFATFDAATAAALHAFPGRMIQTALDDRPTCDRCGGQGRNRVPGGGPFGPGTSVACARCNGTGLTPRRLGLVTR